MYRSQSSTISGPKTAKASSLRRLLSSSFRIVSEQRYRMRLLLSPCNIWSTAQPAIFRIINSLLPQPVPISSITLPFPQCRNSLPISSDAYDHRIVSAGINSNCCFGTTSGLFCSDSAFSRSSSLFTALACSACSFCSSSVSGSSSHLR